MGGGESARGGVNQPRGGVLVRGMQPGPLTGEVEPVQPGDGVGIHIVRVGTRGAVVILGLDPGRRVDRRWGQPHRKPVRSDLGRDGLGELEQ